MDYSTLLFLDCKATLWEKEPPTGQTSEVIGVDVAIVDTVKNQMIEHESLLVKPRKSKVSNFCERVFGIKQSKLDSDGVTFPEAYRRIRIHYMSRDRLWASWGSYDKYIIEKQCKSMDLESLFAYPHTDIERLFYTMTGANDSPSLENALKYCEISTSGNGAVDMANIYMRMAKGLRPPVKSRIIVSGKYNQASN